MYLYERKRGGYFIDLKDTEVSNFKKGHCILKHIRYNE